ncbi:hypothetical protein FOC1_g10009866, partial [Fusarium oxysporum f. sp. cubense race 1]
VRDFQNCTPAATRKQQGFRSEYRFPRVIAARDERE